MMIGSSASDGVGEAGTRCSSCRMGMGQDEWGKVRGRACSSLYSTGHGPRHMACHMFQDGHGQIQLMCRGMRQGMKHTRRFGVGINSERSKKGRSWPKGGRHGRSLDCLV